MTVKPANELPFFSSPQDVIRAIRKEICVTTLPPCDGVAYQQTSRIHAEFLYIAEEKLDVEGLTRAIAEAFARTPGVTFKAIEVEYDPGKSTTIVVSYHTEDIGALVRTMLAHDGAKVTD